jgi:hypothetical protein
MEDSMPHTITLEFQVGDEVFDDLMYNPKTKERHKCKVVGVAYHNGASLDLKELNHSHHCIGYRVDSEWLDGLRHPWELTALDDSGELQQ